MLLLQNKRNKSQIPPLLLDSYPAIFAVSPFKLSNSFTGSPFRIRRSSDSSEQNIGFTANYFDIASFYSFVGFENLFAQSEAINTWGSNNNTITQNTTTSPTGTTTAETVTPNTSNLAHNFFSAIALTLNEWYTFSIYVKPNGYNWVQLLGSSGFDSSNLWVNFNISTGAVGFKGSATNTEHFGIDIVGNGWYRIWLRAKCITATTGQIVIAVLNADINARNPAFAGDGTSGIFAWGGQMNTNIMKIYTPTTGTALTNRGYLPLGNNQGFGGATYNAVQTTQANQPELVIDSNDKVHLFFDGVDDRLRCDALASLFNGTNIPRSSFYVTQTLNASSATRQDFFGCGHTDANTFQAEGIINSDMTVLSRNSAGTLINYAQTLDNINNQRMLTSYFRTSVYNAFKNGSQSITNQNIDVGSQTISIGSLGATTYNGGVGISFFNGFMQEVIIDNADDTTNRTAIESNINTRHQLP